MSDGNIEKFINENFDIPEIRAALTVAFSYGQIDGAHHKTWVIDQIVRELICDEFLYERALKEYMSGEDGPETYEWDQGIAP